MKKIIILGLAILGLSVSGCSTQKAMHSKSQGVNQNGMEEICNSDNIGCTGVGLMYYEGKEVKQDYSKAFKYLKKSCDKKTSIGCRIIGNMYVNGKGVKQNFGKATEFYKKACNYGDKGACENFNLINGLKKRR